MNKLLMSLLLGIASNLIFAQNDKYTEWTESEREIYQNLNNLAEYVYKKNKSEISKDTLFEDYIYFDYVLNDTLVSRRESRLDKFDTLFYYFRKTLNGIGIHNLDAKPIRFYRSHKIYEPFERNLADIEGAVFAYFEKEKPDQPLGTLWFDTETNKLISWILINQGGYRYFLTFSLM